MSDKCEHDEWEDSCPCCLRYEISKLTKQLAERDGEIEQLELQIKQLENGDFYRQLEQQLVEEKKAAGHWMEQSCKDHNKAEKLEQQLAHKQEQCDQLAHEVLELEQQLSRYQSKYNNLLAVAHRDGGHYLAQHGEEKAGEAAITAILTAYHSNDRYQGAVEVEGIWKQDGILFYPLPTVQLEENKRVRVLVMKSEVE